MNLQRLLLLAPFLLGANESALPPDSYKVRIAQELSEGNRFLEVEVQDTVFGIHDYHGDTTLDWVTKTSLKDANKCTEETHFITIGGNNWFWSKIITNYPERETELALVERIYSDVVEKEAFARTPIPAQETLKTVTSKIEFIAGWQVHKYPSSEVKEGKHVVSGTEEIHIGYSKNLLGFPMDQAVTLVSRFEGTEDYTIFNEATYQRMDIHRPFAEMVFLNPAIETQLKSALPKAQPFSEALPLILDQITKGPILIDARVFPTGELPVAYHSKYRVESTAGICKGYILHNK